MGTSPSYQAREGAQLCVVHFLKPASEDSRTVVLPADGLLVVKIKDYPGSFRCCLAEFPAVLYEEHRESTPFSERLSESPMFYFDCSVVDVDKLADQGKYRSDVDRLRAAGIDTCAKVRLDEAKCVIFPFRDGDKVMQTIRSINMSHVTSLKPRAKVLT